MLNEMFGVKQVAGLFWMVIVASGCARTESRTSSNASRQRSPAASAWSSDPDSQSVDHDLDRLLVERWADAGIPPAPPADDATFLRRVSLDLTGRIPTAPEVRRFLENDDEEKRRELVDALLKQDTYAEHWAGVYTDLLLGGATKLRPAIADQTREWLSSQFAAGTGYDDIVTAVLTVNGSFDGPGPHGFLLSHGEKRNVESVTGKTAKLFLGITLECAQCHDHPSDPRYAQQDFYEMAAFFARTKARYKKGSKGRIATITTHRRAEMRMPTIADAPGQHSGRQVEPRFLGREPGASTQTRREALANAVVQSDLFAKTVVARTWARLFGHGVVPRWDDLGGELDSKHPALLKHLSQQFVRDGYDHRALLRTIVLSTAYRRASRSPDRTEAMSYKAQQEFAQASVRPMDAEQLFRSLIVATHAEHIDSKAFRSNARKRKRRALAEYRFVFADDEMGHADTFSSSVPQALLLLNGELVRRGTKDLRGTTIYSVLSDYEQPEARVQALYMHVFGRRPTQAQARRALDMLGEREHTSSAYEDLMHAMLLSAEFLTIH